MLFCSYIICLLRNQWLMERLREAMGAALVFFISHEKKKWLVAARNLQSIKTLLTLELSQYRKNGSMFSSSEPVAARSDCRRLGNASVCARQSYPRKQSLRAAPRAWPLILPSKPSITFWNSLRRDCQMTGMGSNLDSNFVMVRLAAGQIGEWTGLDPSACFGVSSCLRHEIDADRWL